METKTYIVYDSTLLNGARRGIRVILRKYNLVEFSPFIPWVLHYCVKIRRITFTTVQTDGVARHRTSSFTSQISPSLISLTSRVVWENCKTS